jgi:TPP-dependent pyruvate/acetoin dehydrogenase alpha subunit
MSLSRQKRLQMYEVMMHIRHFEEKAIELSRRGLMPGRTHPYIGQEAVAAGACAALQDGDCIVSTHRGGGHLIAKGANLRKLFAEWMGKATGYSGGRGGPMHVSIFELGVLCTTGIVGSGIPVAAGAALAAQMQDSDQVMLCFFGDGASNTGAFHEGLNLAAVWKLSVVFLCENNQYGESMPISKAIAIEDIACRAASYGMPGVVVDGNDVEAVYKAVEEAAQRARRGKGPSLIEAKTYRIGGHFDGESSHYRSREEIDEWQKRDPIDRYRRWLLEEGICQASELAAIEQRVQEEVEQAARQAINDPFPALDSLVKDVWVPGSWEVVS